MRVQKNRTRDVLFRLIKPKKILVAVLAFIALFALTARFHGPTQPIISVVAVAPVDKPNPVENTPSHVSAFQDFGMVIPTIALDVPVIANVDGGNEGEYLAALEKGVAQFKNTALPGSAGNIFIFGHSSDWRWHPGNYKKVFVRIPELAVGNEIFIWYQQKPYTYKVTETHIVEPSDISWLSPTTENYLTLSTCYPINTSKQRFIVRAMQE